MRYFFFLSILKLALVAQLGFSEYLPSRKYGPGSGYFVQVDPHYRDFFSGYFPNHPKLEPEDLAKLAQVAYWQMHDILRQSPTILGQRTIPLALTVWQDVEGNVVIASMGGRVVPNTLSEGINGYMQTTNHGEDNVLKASKRYGNSVFGGYAITYNSVGSVLGLAPACAGWCKEKLSWNGDAKDAYDFISQRNLASYTGEPLGYNDECPPNGQAEGREGGWVRRSIETLLARVSATTIPTKGTTRKTGATCTKLPAKTPSTSQHRSRTALPTSTQAVSPKRPFTTQRAKKQNRSLLQRPQALHL